jgi:hypothetical protein
VDAVFLMGDSTSPQVMRGAATPGIQILNFTQADGYTRRITYLNSWSFPKAQSISARTFPPRMSIWSAPRSDCWPDRTSIPRCPISC